MNIKKSKPVKLDQMGKEVDHQQNKYLELVDHIYSIENEIEKERIKNECDFFIKTLERPIVPFTKKKPIVRPKSKPRIKPTVVHEFWGLNTSPKIMPLDTAIPLILVLTFIFFIIVLSASAENHWKVFVIMYFLLHYIWEMEKN